MAAASAFAARAIARSANASRLKAMGTVFADLPRRLTIAPRRDFFNNGAAHAAIAALARRRARGSAVSSGLANTAGASSVRAIETQAPTLIM